MSFAIFSLMARHLFFSALLRFVFLGLCCAAFKQAARFDVFSLLVVPPQGFCFCFLFFVKLFDKFWRFSWPRVSTKFDCPNTSRKYSSANARLLLGISFEIDGVQPSLESPDLLPQRSKETNKMLFVGTRCKDSWPPHSRRVQPHLQELILAGHC